jgi:hypothetical protein
MSDKNKLNSLNYYYKHKERLDNKRKQLYQQQKYKIIKIINEPIINEPIINEPTIKINQRVLNRCHNIIKYELLLNKIK